MSNDTSMANAQNPTLTGPAKYQSDMGNLAMFQNGQAGNNPAPQAAPPAPAPVQSTNPSLNAKNLRHITSAMILDDAENGTDITRQTMDTSILTNDSPLAAVMPPDLLDSINDTRDNLSKLATIKDPSFRSKEFNKTTDDLSSDADSVLQQLEDLSDPTLRHEQASRILARMSQLTNGTANGVSMLEGQEEMQKLQQQYDTLTNPDFDANLKKVQTFFMAVNDFAADPTKFKKTAVYQQFQTGTLEHSITKEWENIANDNKEQIAHLTARKAQLDAMPDSKANATELNEIDSQMSVLNLDQSELTPDANTLVTLLTKGDSKGNKIDLTNPDDVKWLKSNVDLDSAVDEMQKQVDANKENLDTVMPDTPANRKAVAFRMSRYENMIKDVQMIKDYDPAQSLKDMEEGDTGKIDDLTSQISDINKQIMDTTGKATNARQQIAYVEGNMALKKKRDALLDQLYQLKQGEQVTYPAEQHIFTQSQGNLREVQAAKRDLEALFDKQLDHINDKNYPAKIQRAKDRLKAAQDKAVNFMYQQYTTHHSK
jgi:hypothetical protein